MYGSLKADILGHAAPLMAAQGTFLITAGLLYKVCLHFESSRSPNGLAFLQPIPTGGVEGLTTGALVSEEKICQL